MKNIFLGLFILFCCLNGGISHVIAKPNTATSKAKIQTPIDVTDLSNKNISKSIKVNAAMTYQELLDAIKTAFEKDPKTLYIASANRGRPVAFNGNEWEDVRRELNYAEKAELFVAF